jgi:hypothetical protein
MEPQKNNSSLPTSVKKFIDHNTPRKVQFMGDFRESNRPKEFINDGGYCVVDSITEPIYKEELKFQYSMNSDGFRSQHFKVLKKEDTNILYAGCSMTFGVGLPYEYIWPNLLSNKIKNKMPLNNIESFNVASPGASIHEILRNCFIFFENYGNPDYLFVSVPDIERSISFDNSDEKFKQIIPSEVNLTQKMSKQLIYALSSINSANNWLLCSDFMLILETYCRASGIKLIWTTWLNTQAEDWQSLKFKNYLKTEGDGIITWYSPLNGQEKPKGLKENTESLPYWNYGRDGAHPGTQWSIHVADRFLIELEKRSML